jgi:hypothetical protein
MDFWSREKENLDDYHPVIRLLKKKTSLRYFPFFIQNIMTD